MLLWNWLSYRGSSTVATRLMRTMTTRCITSLVIPSFLTDLKLTDFTNCELDSGDSCDVSLVLFGLSVLKYRATRFHEASALLVCADLEGSGLASDCLVTGPVRAPLCLWAPHLDHQGQRKNLQETVCGLCQWEAATHRQLHWIQLQPPSPAVSLISDF